LRGRSFFDGKYLAKRRALILASRFPGQEGFFSWPHIKCLDFTPPPPPHCPSSF